MSVIRVNDGGGLYDEVGLCTAIIKLIDQVEVKGSDNWHSMLLAIDGIRKIQESLQKIRDERDKHKEEREAAENVDSNSVVGKNI